jgi:hypothetical protein
MSSPENRRLFDTLQNWTAANYPGFRLSHVVLHIDGLPVPISLPLPLGATQQQRQPLGDSPRHSPDFRSVHWKGQDYIFSPAQAAVIACLWEAWEDGMPDLGQETILEKAGSESNRLRDVFKDHPAWGVVIVSRGKGIFGLSVEE